MIQIIQAPEVGKFVAINTEGSSFTKYGTITEVTPKWIRIEGSRYTRSGWILRSSLTACYTPSSLPIYIR
jgi:hypothetical protein